MLDSLAVLLPGSFHTFHLVLLLLPPLAVWWLAFRISLGSRRFTSEIVISAPTDAIWRLLDSHESQGGWGWFDESPSEPPDRLLLVRRPRGQFGLLPPFQETRHMEEAAKRLSRRGGNVHCEIKLEPVADGTRASALYETQIVGLWRYEQTRLAIRRDLFELADASIGRDLKAVPIFRLCGWRPALLSHLGASVAFSSFVTAAFVVGKGASLAEAAGFEAVSVIGCFAVLSLLIPAWLVHEFGHGLAFVAFGGRGAMLNVVHFLDHRPFRPRQGASVFEAGVVSLAGPALSALVLLMVIPLAQDLLFQQSIAARLLGGVAWIFAGMLTTVNLYALMPFGSDDMASTLDAIFGGRPPRLVWAGFGAAFAWIFDTNDPRAVALFAVLAYWWGDSPPLTRQAISVWRSLALAAGLVLVVGIYAHAATFLLHRPAPAATTTQRS